MNQIRVLYTEDDPADRELAVRHLGQHAPDIEVRVAGTGTEALQALEDERFDVILLDYRLPDMDGLQLLWAVSVSMPEVPVVMVTGGGDREVAVTALKSGAADYVAKDPGYLDRLPAVIREAMGRCRHRRSQRASAYRILYVEDEPADAELTVRHLALHAAHLQVKTACTGIAALRQLETSTFDLLLLDYHLPDLNGLEILQGLHERGIHLPVVMLTGQDSEEIAVSAMKLGAADYLVKQEGYLTTLSTTIESTITKSALANLKGAILPTPNQTVHYAEAIARLGERTRSLLRVVEAQGQAAISVSRTGSIRWATPRARQWLQAYFGVAPHTDDRLPEELEQWRRHQDAQSMNRTGPPALQEPLVCDRGERRLLVRHVSEWAGCLLLLEERLQQFPTVVLERLGLTRREMEVLTWVTDGKTNIEIGLILDMSPRTVQKHLQHIFEKLGVETRTAAAMRALALTPSREP